MCDGYSGQRELYSHSSADSDPLIYADGNEYGDTEQYAYQYADTHQYTDADGNRNTDQYPHVNTDPYTLGAHRSSS